MKRKNVYFLIGFLATLMTFSCQYVLAATAYTYVDAVDLNYGSLYGGTLNSLKYNDNSYYTVLCEYEGGGYYQIDVFMNFDQTWELNYTRFDFNVLECASWLDQVHVVLYFDYGTQTEDFGNLDDDDTPFELDTSGYNHVTGIRFDKRVLWDSNFMIQFDYVYGMKYT